MSVADRNTGLADRATKEIIASGTDTDMVLGEGDADNEGQIYTLKLSTKPAGEVIVTPSSSDSGAVTVDKPEGLTFTTTNWSEEQQVRVRPESDEDADDETVIIKHRVSGGGYDKVTGPNVEVKVNDDDLDTVPEFNRSVENWSYIKGTEIVLRLPAATGGNGPLSYSLSDDNGNLPAGLSFNFNDSGGELSGTPTGVQEATNYTYTATDSDRNTRSNDESALNFTIKVIAKKVIASGTDTDMVLKEGAAANEEQIYTLKLSTEPTGDVIVTPSSSDPSVATVAYGGMPEGLIFTAITWSNEQQVRVRLVKDIDFDGEEATIEHKVSGGGYDKIVGPNIIVKINDDIASFLIPGIVGHIEVTKLGGIVVVVGIIIIIGIITWYKSEIIGYIVEWAGYSRVVIKERKAHFVMAIILMILGSVLGSVKAILGCK